MKATLDIPDDLYRRVKARSAMEGRPLRSVAIELFQTWLQDAQVDDSAKSARTSEERQVDFPWLAISQKYVKPGTSEDMEAVRESIARGWVAEVSGKIRPDSPAL